MDNPMKEETAIAKMRVSWRLLCFHMITRYRNSSNIRANGDTDRDINMRNWFQNGFRASFEDKI